MQQPPMKAKLEYLRLQAKQRFNNVRETWIECGLWALPHRIKWMLSQTEGQRNNQHIVDSSHILALRSYVAGFLEGNTSASRPWYRLLSQDPEANLVPENKAWLEKYTKRTLDALENSNFYHASGGFYYDFGVFNTGALWVDELPNNELYFHNLIPGGYFVINNAIGQAVVLVREFSMTVKALVDGYGQKTKDGSWDWSNFTSRVKRLYDNGNYTQTIDCVHIVMENDQFDATKPQAGMNKKWISITYELGGQGGQYYVDGQEFGAATDNPNDVSLYLKIKASKRKPFIIGVSDHSSNFEYGEKGPTLDALGLIRSLNKKAIGKDQALEQMLRPPLQGPANLKKSYITTAPNSFVPLDANSLKPGGGLKTIFEVNPGIGSLIQDVSDLRDQVEKLYYADYLLYLSRNPKTRTATETNAVVQEQQLIIGPNLQSLNWTYNIPVVEFIMDFVLDRDPYLPPPPKGLSGQFMRTDFISVFAQAQKSADLPSIDRYIQMATQIGAIPQGAKIWDKVNLDKLADLYEDRLFLPEGLNNPQAKVDAIRQQAQAQQQRDQMLHQTIPALAGAASDVGIQAQQPQGQGPQQ